MDFNTLKNKWYFWAGLAVILFILVWFMVSAAELSKGKEALQGAKDKYSQGDLTGAEKDYQALVKGSLKNDAEAWNNLGNIYRDRKKYEEAANAYRRAIELNSKYEAAYRNIAFVYIDWAAADADRKDVHLSDGIKLLEEGYKDNPKSVTIVEDLINLYLKTGNQDKANEYFEIRKKLLGE